MLKKGLKTNYNFVFHKFLKIRIIKLGKNSKIERFDGLIDSLQVLAKSKDPESIMRPIRSPISCGTTKYDVVIPTNSRGKVSRIEMTAGNKYLHDFRSDLRLSDHDGGPKIPLIHVAYCCIILLARKTSNIVVAHISPGKRGHRYPIYRFNDLNGLGLSVFREIYQTQYLKVLRKVVFRVPCS